MHEARTRRSSKLASRERMQPSEAPSLNVSGSLRSHLFCPEHSTSCEGPAAAQESTLRCAALGALLPVAPCGTAHSCAPELHVLGRKLPEAHPLSRAGDPWLIDSHEKMDPLDVLQEALRSAPCILSRDRVHLGSTTEIPKNAPILSNFQEKPSVPGAVRALTSLRSHQEALWSCTQEKASPCCPGPLCLQTPRSRQGLAPNGNVATSILHLPSRSPHGHAAH